MPASANVSTGAGVDVAGAWKDFLDLESAARTSAQTALNALSQSAPAATAQTVIDTYSGIFNTAFENSQQVLGTAISQVSDFFASMFEQMQGILGGGGLVSDVNTAFGQIGNGFDSSFGDGPGVGGGGGGIRDVVLQDDETAIILTVALQGDSASITMENNIPIFADEVTLNSGREDSIAKCTIQAPSNENTYPSVSGKPDGPSGKVKGLIRAEVQVNGAESSPLLVGSVTKQSDDLLLDGSTFIISCDKYLLRGIKVRGSFHWDPNVKAVRWRQRGPCIFNPEGRPNCVDTPYGPMFALTPDLGNVAPTSTAVSDKIVFTFNPSNQSDPSEDIGKEARFWTIADAIEYLRFCYYGETSSGGTQYENSFTTLDDTLVSWPKGLSSAIMVGAAPSKDDKAAAAGIKNADREQGASAKLIHKDIDRLDLFEALSDLCESAGPYGLYFRPIGNGKSEMRIVSTKSRYFYGQGQKQVIRRVNTHGTKNTPRITSGNIEVDYQNTFTSVVVEGDIVFVETRCVYWPSPGDGTVTLEPAWTDEEEEDFQDDFDRLLATVIDPIETFKQCCALYPRVFCAYRVSKDLDYLAGTKYEGWPRLQANPPVLAHLLTWVADYGTGANRKLLPMQVRFEIDDADDPGNANKWHTLTDNDGFSLDQQGNIYLPGLREAAISDQNAGTFTGTAFQGGSAMAKRGIRATFAIATDHRLSYAVAFDASNVGNAGGAGNNLMFCDPSGERFNMQSGVRRQYLAAVDETYREYLRKDSWPIPQSTKSINNDPNYVLYLPPNGRVDKTGKGGDGGSAELLTDKAFVKTHAYRRGSSVMKPERTAHMVFDGLVLWHPGTTISRLQTEGGGNIPAFVIGACLTKWSFNQLNQETIMDYT